MATRLPIRFLRDEPLAVVMNRQDYELIRAVDANIDLSHTCYPMFHHVGQGFLHNSVEIDAQIFRKDVVNIIKFRLNGDTG